MIDKQTGELPQHIHQHLISPSFINLVVNNGTRLHNSSVITVGKCSILSFYLHDGSKIIFRNLFAIGRDRTDIIMAFDFFSSTSIKGKNSSINERGTNNPEVNRAINCDGEELDKILHSEEIRSLYKQHGILYHAIVTLPHAGMYSFIGKGEEGNKIAYFTFNNQVANVSVY